MVAKQTRLLVVDDDPTITQIYDEVLRSQGYDVVTAGSVGQATARMDDVNGDVHVLIVDLGLPDGDGADFVKDAKTKYGERPTMFVSGWSDEFWQLQDAPGRWVIMRKPIAIPKLLAAVRWLANGGDRPPELDE
jgi:two-component system cell cycle sensor histidine kinase/response regulator CckA